ncbi:MAG: ATP-binding cassette domain-containing protein [Acutalibacteraceae bacterium]
MPDKGMFFVLGKSGSGKSTLLNVLGGLDKADSGSVVIDGNDIHKFGEKELDGYRNGYCGFVFQEFNLLPMLDVGENVRF